MPTNPPIERAPRYRSRGDLCIVTCFYNPAGFQTKLRNFERFAEVLTRSDVHWLTVECAFGSEPFTLPACDCVLQIRARDVLWQKEQLLNLAVRQLPDSCTKVAWLDCDILFDNPEWPAQTSELLDDYAVVQPFDRAVRLPYGADRYTGAGEIWNSFASVAARRPETMTQGRFEAHGHTGFAWAARRSLIERHGLYSACVSGSGDHMMAHAWYGDWEGPCLDRILGGAGPHYRHFTEWCEAMYPDVKSSVGYTAGAVLHLWHGEMENRRYVTRNQELAAMGFDPQRDLLTGDTGCLEWSPDRPDLKEWALRYYYGRKEDDPPPAVGEPAEDTVLHNRITALEASLGRAHFEIEALRRRIPRQ